MPSPTKQSDRSPNSANAGALARAAPAGLQPVTARVVRTTDARDPRRRSHVESPDSGTSTAYSSDRDRASDAGSPDHDGSGRLSAGHKQSPGSAPRELAPFLVERSGSPEYVPKGWDPKLKRELTELEEGMDRLHPSGRTRRVVVAAGLFLAAAGLTAVAIAGLRTGIEPTGLGKVASGKPAGLVPLAAAHGKDDDLADLSDRYAGSAYRGPGMLRPEEMKHEEDEHMGKDAVGPSDQSIDGAPNDKDSLFGHQETDDDERREGQMIADREEAIRLRRLEASKASASRSHLMQGTTSSSGRKAPAVSRQRHRARQSNLETAFADSPGAEVLPLASDDIPAGNGYGKIEGNKLRSLEKSKRKLTKEERGLWVVENAES